MEVWVVTANVKGYDYDVDIITVQYPSEPGCTYIYTQWRLPQ